jgi:hypothetical protein
MSPLFDLHTFVLLLFAVLVGIMAGVLTFLSTASVPQALLVGGGSTGVALAWGNSMIRPPDGN